MARFVNAEQEVPGGWGQQPGARSIRQENKETELVLPGLQTALRSGADILAALLVVIALMLLGRWVIWAAVCYMLFSEWYDRVIDAAVSPLHGPAARAVEIAAVGFKYAWVVIGYPLLTLVVPVTWTMDEIWLHRYDLVPVWPFVMGKATSWHFEFRPLARLICLICVTAPLFSWRILRDRMKWSLWEFTPFGPINTADQGIDPHKWGPRADVKADRGEGIIIEKTDYAPHTERVAEGVYISNGSGHSSVRVDMRWVTLEQWQDVARLLIVEEQPFTETVLGRGRVFPTHGPRDDEFGANLGFRFFREQMIESGYAEYKGGHPNEGVILTPAGEDFMRRRFLEGGYDADSN